MKFPAHLNKIKRLAPFAIVLFSMMIAIGANLQSLDLPFSGDDRYYIVENAKLAGLHLADLWHLFMEPYNPWEFLPLRDLSYWLDMALFGMTPSAFRLHNILLYSICCLLIYPTTLSLWRYFRPEKTAAAPLVAATVVALFALHPAHVEAVAWISGRKDVLSGMFAMLAFWLAVGGRKGEGIAPWRAGTALVALAAAMLAKTTAVVVAPAIALFWVILWLDTPAISRRRTMLLWPAASLLLAASIALIFMGHSTVKLPTYYGVEAYTRAFAILGWMARLAVTLEPRLYYYPVLEDPWFWGMVALGIIVLLAGVGGMTRLLLRRSIEGYALIAFTLLCLPYTQILPYATYSLVSDRFLFIAVWPILLLLVALAWHLRPLPRTLLLLAILLPWTYQIVVQPDEWRIPGTIFDRELRAYPGNSILEARKVLSLHGPDGFMSETYQIADGITDAEIRNVILKLVQADNAVKVVSSGNLLETVSSLINLGSNLEAVPIRIKWDIPLRTLFVEINGTLDSEWLKLTRKFPDDLSVRYNAGLRLLEFGKYESAATNLRVAAESSQLPAHVRGKTLKYLGVALLKSGHIAAAEIPLLSALEQVPPDVEAYCSLAEVYRRTSQSEKAAQAETKCHR